MKKELPDHIKLDWVPENGPLTRALRDRVKYMWKCHNCEKITKQSIANRKRRRCSCVGRLAAKRVSRIDANPHLRLEWFNLIPIERALRDVSYAWKCKACEHVWRSRLRNRLQGAGCPKCASRIAGVKKRQYGIPDNVRADWAEPQISIDTANRRCRYRFKHVASQRGEVPCGRTWTTLLWARVSADKLGCPHCFGTHSLRGNNTQNRDWIQPGVRVIVTRYRGKPTEIECMVESVTTNTVRVDLLLKSVPKQHVKACESAKERT